jgi:hypothetical protein
MTKKTIIIISIIVVVLLALFIVPLIKDSIVEKYYPTKACGHWGSMGGAINKDCECSGLKLAKSIFGSTKRICFGECTNCECWFYNSTSKSRQTVLCPE